MPSILCTLKMSSCVKRPRLMAERRDAIAAEKKRLKVRKQEECEIYSVNKNEVVRACGRVLLRTVLM